MDVNIAVVVGYFLLMFAIGAAFRKMASQSASDYFRGGGRMLWWMVGSSAFMIQFSAWTFTGAAGEAFRNGLPACYVYIGNCVGYLVATFWFGRRFCQLRCDAPTLAIRQRFGRGNEQFFTWSVIPLSILQGAVSLNALAVFFSAVTGFHLSTTLWLTGLSVLALSFLGGAWGVVASDFVQSIVVAVMSVACAIVALVKLGGPGEIVARFPVDFLTGPDYSHGSLLVGSFLFLCVKQMLAINNMKDAYRFLNAKDSRNATRAALFALVLMTAGALIWMVPPWAAAILYPDAAVAHAHDLGAKSGDAVFLVFVERAMPLGTVGLLMAGMFSATMASMDAALNHNAGIFVRSFYQPVIRGARALSERESVLAGKGMNVLNGLVIIVIALGFSHLKGLSLFTLMMRVGTLATLPIVVPLFLGLLIRRVPDWAGWATVVVGLGVSCLCGAVISGHELSRWFGWSFSARETSEFDTMWAVLCHCVLTGGFFVATRRFHRQPDAARAGVLAKFWRDYATPVHGDGLQGEFDRLQRLKLGRITQGMTAGLLAMVAIPNPAWGRLVFLGCALAVGIIGTLLVRSARATKPLPDAAMPMHDGTRDGCSLRATRSSA
ncbi:sodium:solute symporter family transporter [Burkholderia gladioli]|uniref:sodium:solute symporter family transporter n=1 Tax=Burkholderia gladioli TaxID=28095 RepID=UPI001640D974|nr:transporter [Burkholderia gladioli]